MPVNVVFFYPKSFLQDGMNEFSFLKKHVTPYSGSLTILIKVQFDQIYEELALLYLKVKPHRKLKSDRIFACLTA